MRQYVVLGCGPAGLECAREIARREAGAKKAKVTLVSREADPFYIKPALADFLAGRINRSTLVVEPPAFEDGAEVEVRAGQRVMRLFPGESRILLSDGTSLYYDRLLLATGGAPRLVGYAERLRNKVHTLTTLADAVRLRRQGIHDGGWVLVSGAGRPGLETVRGFAAHGMRVVYLTGHTRFWASGDAVSRTRVLEKLREERIEVLFDETVLDVLDLSGERYRVVTSSRRTLDVDLVCVAGLPRPVTHYLQGSGVLVDEGVVVNRELQTNFDNIFAAGDVARVYDDEGNCHRVNFGWESAGAQGRVAGHNIVEGGGMEVEVERGAYFNAYAGAPLMERWTD